MAGSGWAACMHKACCTAPRCAALCYGRSIPILVVCLFRRMHSSNATNLATMARSMSLAAVILASAALATVMPLAVAQPPGSNPGLPPSATATGLAPQMIADMAGEGNSVAPMKCWITHWAIGRWPADASFRCMGSQQCIPGSDTPCPPPCPPSFSPPAAS